MCVNIALGTQLVYSHGRTSTHCSHNLTALCNLVFNQLCITEVSASISTQPLLSSSISNSLAIQSSILKLEIIKTIIIV